MVDASPFNLQPTTTVNITVHGPDLWVLLRGFLLRRGYISSLPRCGIIECDDSEWNHFQIEERNMRTVYEDLSSLLKLCEEIINERPSKSYNMNINEHEPWSFTVLLVYKIGLPLEASPIFYDPQRSALVLSELRLLIHHALCHPDIVKSSNQYLTDKQIRQRSAYKALKSLSALEHEIRDRYEWLIQKDDCTSSNNENRVPLQAIDLFALGLEKIGPRDSVPLLASMRDDHSLIQKKFKKSPRMIYLVCSVLSAMASEAAVEKFINSLDTLELESHTIARLLLGLAIQADNPTIILALMRKGLIAREDIGSILRYAYHLRSSPSIVSFIKKSGLGPSKFSRSERAGTTQCEPLGSRTSRLARKAVDLFKIRYQEFHTYLHRLVDIRNRGLDRLRMEVAEAKPVYDLGMSTIRRILNPNYTVRSLSLKQIVSCILVADALRGVRDDHEELPLAGDGHTGLITDVKYVIQLARGTYSLLALKTQLLRRSTTLDLGFKPRGGSSVQRAYLRLLGY